MSSWRKLAEELREDEAAQHDRHNRHDSSAAAPIADPLTLARGWRAALDRLDPATPLHGLDAKRWGQLLRDAEWLLGNFGRRAACDGWTAGELFGLWPDKDSWGGLADRLQDSRSLVMTADRACWRMMYSDAAEQFNRGACPDLRPLWEPSE